MAGGTVSPSIRAPLLAAIVLGAVLLWAGGCRGSAESARLASQASAFWEVGKHEDAARVFLTLAELYPGSRLAEEALFLAASLHQHYLRNSGEATRIYQNLIVSYPRGRFFIEGRENLASLYEADNDSRHRALQIYQRLLLAPEMKDRNGYLRFKIGQLNLQLGKMDQARLEFRDLLIAHPNSRYRAEIFYLVAYSYYLEKRNDLALAVFRHTAREFPGTPIAIRSRFFIADTLEEQGHMREAIKAFNEVKEGYPHPNIIERRIRTLESRIRRGVR